MHRGEGFFDFEQKIPLYVAANGPLGCKTAGLYGDGRVAIMEGLRQFAQSTDQVRQGALGAGRQLPDPFPQAMLVSALVVRPGETLASERVVEAIGAEVMASVHYWWEALVQTGEDPAIPEPCRDVWDQFKDFARGLNLPIDELHRRIHGGHCTYLREEERRFVTPELIKASSPLVGTPDEIIDHLRAYEAAGLAEVVILCPTAASREVYTDIRDHVINRY